MSEYAKLSRNRGAPTDSNTGQRSRQGPTHPFTGDSGSPSAYSQGRSGQVQSPEENELNFEIAHQYIMPLISTIKDENLHLKHQRQQIQNQMNTLQKLSQMVLAQNQKLRKHYGQRTNDIKKLITTISINTSQEINDIEHQAFLLKESNCAIVKEIEILMKHNTIAAEQNQGKRRCLEEIAQKNVMNEQTLRDLLVKNKQLGIKCQRAQVSENKMERYIEDSVNNLLSEVTALKNKNKSNILKARSALNQHNSQRPEVEDNLNNIVLKIMELSNESKQMQEKSRAAEQQLYERQQAYEQSVSNVMRCIQEHERKRIKQNEDESQIAEKKNLLGASIQHIKQQENTLSGLTVISQGLRRSIQAKKDSLRQKQQAQRDKIEKQEAQHKQNIRKIRDSINQHIADANTESIARIQPESMMVEKKLEESKEEFATLVQEVDEFQQNISRLENPIKAIIRMQFELKRQKKNQ